MEKQVNKSHYSFLKYLSKNRFMSYYYQLRYVYGINPVNILEIGPGNNFLKKILEDNFNIKTLDIDPEIVPDILASVDKMPIDDNSFDLVCCFQVLEHLPFDKFEKALSEIYRVSNKDVVISLPFSGFKVGIKLKIKNHEKSFLFLLSSFFKRHKFDGQHYWEVGKIGFSKKRIIKIIQKYFIIKESKIYIENTYHLFFKLEKK